MNLLDLLARELDSWPSADGVECGYIVQEEDGELYSTHNMPPSYMDGTCWHRNRKDDGKCGYFRPVKTFSTSDDWKTAIITRDMWQAARDKLKGDNKVPKANKDGWIRHRGGKCPVAEGTAIDVRHRDGQIITNVRALAGKGVQSYNLAHDTPYKAPGEIMAYRVVEAEQLSLASAASDGELWSDAKAMPSPKPIDGPLQWRDRIIELDREQTTADLAHKAATDARSAEKAELLAKLKAEGLALIEREGDMSDPSNWLPGDKVEIEDSSNVGWTRLKGIIGQLEIDSDAGWFVHFPGNAVWYLSDNTKIKWHSRPTK